MEVFAVKNVNAYIEPMPKGGGPTESFQIEFADNSPAKGPYPTQKAAIEAAKKMGHKPLIARVRITDKGNPDHWRNE
jgi:hypothetical protein